jgi:hypothetical protein
MTNRRAFFAKLMGARPAFSLESLYRDRPVPEPGVLPKFELRPGLPDPRTLSTPIGTPALSRRARHERIAHRMKKRDDRES